MLFQKHISYRLTLLNQIMCESNLTYQICNPHNVDNDSGASPSILVIAKHKWHHIYRFKWYLIFCVNINRCYYWQLQIIYV
jgi:hypothetical protein